MTAEIKQIKQKMAELDGSSFVSNDPAMAFQAKEEMLQRNMVSRFHKANSKDLLAAERQHLKADSGFGWKWSEGGVIFDGTRYNDVTPEDFRYELTLAPGEDIRGYLDGQVPDPPIWKIFILSLLTFCLYRCMFAKKKHYCTLIVTDRRILEHAREASPNKQKSQRLTSFFLEDLVYGKNTFDSPDQKMRDCCQGIYLLRCLTCFRLCQFPVNTLELYFFQLPPGASRHHVGMDIIGTKSISGKLGVCIIREEEESIVMMRDFLKSVMLHFPHKNTIKAVPRTDQVVRTVGTWSDPDGNGRVVVNTDAVALAEDEQLLSGLKSVTPLSWKEKFMCCCLSTFSLGLCLPFFCCIQHRQKGKFILTDTRLLRVSETVRGIMGKKRVEGTDFEMEFWMLLGINEGSITTRRGCYAGPGGSVYRSLVLDLNPSGKIEIQSDKTVKESALRDFLSDIVAMDVPPLLTNFESRPLKSVKVSDLLLMQGEVPIVSVSVRLSSDLSTSRKILNRLTCGNIPPKNMVQLVLTSHRLMAISSRYVPIFRRAVESKTEFWFLESISRAEFYKRDRCYGFYHILPNKIFKIPGVKKCLFNPQKKYAEFGIDVSEHVITNQYKVSFSAYLKENDLQDLEYFSSLMALVDTPQDQDDLYADIQSFKDMLAAGGTRAKPFLGEQFNDKLE